tara:strand:- start:2712 stop:3365 length:654 start_codon:yes stop_codon:yes gene_type:complete
LSIGILIQGIVTEWTPSVVNEFTENFPDAEILLSTWNNQDVKDIECNIIQLEQPEKTSPHESNINFQIKGSIEGLKNMHADVILKTKTNHFIHNSKIFEIFGRECREDQIMTTGLNSWKNRDYRITDFCQLAKKKVLEEYWYNMPYYDGSYAIAPEVYLTKNYVVNFKKDIQPWNTLIDKYFCLKNYFTDFDIEFEKLVNDEEKQEWLKRIVNENNK